MKRQRRNSSFVLSPPPEEHRWIGFDLDMTIIRYKLENLGKHIFQALAKLLVGKLNYPNWLLDLKYSSTDMLRGVIIDKSLGNIITINQNRCVVSGYHGFRPLSRDEIEKAYGFDRPINWVGVHTIRFMAANSFFEVPYLHMARLLIDKFDQGELKFEEQSDAQDSSPSTVPAHPTPSLTPPTYQYIKIEPPNSEMEEEVAQVSASPYFHIFKDIHTSINYNFGNFNDGFYFPDFKTRIQDFIYERKALIPLLKRLKTQNQKVFLITNSGHQYTDLMCKYALGDNWRELFDLRIYRSRKPHFFLSESPFFELLDPNAPDEVSCQREVPNNFEGVNETQEGAKIELGKEYYGGNWKKLKQDLLHDDPVVYVGDDLIGDITVPRYHAGWSTIAIVEELLDLEKEQSNLFECKSSLDPSDSHLYLPEWGNYLYTMKKQVDNKSETQQVGSTAPLSFWGSLMYHWADIAIPCVQRLIQFSDTDRLLPIRYHPTYVHSKDADKSMEKLLTSARIHTDQQEIPATFICPDLSILTMQSTASKLLEQVSKPKTVVPVKN